MGVCVLDPWWVRYRLPSFKATAVSSAAVDTV